MVAFLDRALDDGTYREIDAALDAQYRVWRRLPIAGPRIEFSFPVMTAVEKMDAAEASGRAIEVGSNFFLFFSSRVSSWTT